MEKLCGSIFLGLLGKELLASYGVLGKVLSE
jgi:hypothetical protein